MKQFMKGLFAFAAFGAGALSGMVAHAADFLPAESRLIALSGAPAAQMNSFTISTTQDLVVTLTDLNTPAAFASASVVVTQANAIVGGATFASPSSSATVQLPAAQGDYVLQVIGTPNPSFSAGAYSACVAPKADPANCIQTASLSGIIVAQSAASDPSLSTLSLTLNVTTAGAYTFTFADFQFPAALSSQPNLALFQGSVPVQNGLGIASGTTLMLTAGTYTLLGLAQADQTTKAGVYGLTITGPPGVAPLLDDSIPVGTIAPATPINNPAAQQLTLKVSDFAFPTALAGASALVTAGGAVVGTTNAAGGAVALPAPAGTLKMWSFATAGSGPGTYEVDLSDGSGPLLTYAQGVNPAGTTNFAFAFVTPSVAAGTYRANAADLQFPSSLGALQFAVAQNGALIGQPIAAGTQNFTAAAGPVVLLVGANALTTGSTTGNGLFDVNLQPAGGASSALLFDRTQVVGTAPALFDTQTKTLGTNGSFDLTLSDLGFPAQFQNLALVVSRGTEVLGKIFGGGTFTFAGTPGQYQLSFVATPATGEQYGLYGLKGAVSPPFLTFTAGASTVIAGDLVQLNWSAAGADSCTASGGNWTGSKAVTQTSESVVVNATTTYTLTCTGSGGTSSKSVSVTATPKPSPPSSGGGAFDWSALAAIAGLLVLRRRRA